MSLLKKTLEQASEISLDEPALQQLMTRGLLDDQFTALAAVETVVEKLQPSFMATDTDWADLLARASDNLALQQQRLLEFYLQCFERENSIGDFRPDQEAPDTIVVLGANPPTLEKRVIQSVPVIQRFSEAMVILSGGGFNIEKPEGGRMKDMLLAYGIKETRLISETDSMDTIGNALFTKLTLKQAGWLKKGLRLLAVTSRFHAHRSLNYFHRIFGAEAQIAVFGVATDQQTQGLQRARHELQSEQAAQCGVFHYSLSPCLQKPPERLDDQTLLFQLLLRHTLYQNRLDLVRKYFPLT